MVPGMGDALAAVLERPVQIAPQPQLTCARAALWPPIASRKQPITLLEEIPNSGSGLRGETRQTARRWAHYQVKRGKTTYLPPRLRFVPGVPAGPPGRPCLRKA